jgi:uncharacterized phage-associated protein
MTTALVVANKIIELCNNKHIEINHLKLQKLLYFVQDAYFKEYGELLFYSPMHAWNYGPVEIGLYKLFSLYKDHPIPTDNVYQISTDALNDKQIAIIKKTVDELANEAPWDLVKKTQKPAHRWDVTKNTKGIGGLIEF